MGFPFQGSRGQISVEYTMIMASMLVILIIIIIIFNSIYVQQSLYTAQVQSSHVVLLLAAGASDVWAQGKGAEARYILNIPQSVNVSASTIGNHTLRLYVYKFGDVFANTPFNISGNWPNHTGTFTASIYNNGTHVLIRPAGGVSLNATGFYFNTSGAQGLLVANRANVSYTVTQTLQIASCPGCSYDKTGITSLASGQSASGTLSVPAMAKGIYSGYLNVSTVSQAGSELLNETFILPITISIP